MKVFGLQGSVYRMARLASRLTAQTSDIAAGRRDALLRFERARRDRLSAERAARARLACGESDRPRASVGRCRLRRTAARARLACGDQTRRRAAGSGSASALLGQGTLAMTSSPKRP